MVSTLDGQSNGDTGPGQGSFQQLALVVGHHCVSCAVDEQERRRLWGHIADWAGGRSRVSVLSADELVLGWHEQLGWWVRAGRSRRAVLRLGREVGDAVPVHGSVDRAGWSYDANGALKIRPLPGQGYEGSEVPACRLTPNSNPARVDPEDVGMCLQIPDRGFRVVQLSRKLRLQSMAIVDGGDGETGGDQLVKELIRPQGLREVAPITEHPGAAVNPHHQRRRAGRRGHPEVKQQRSVARDTGVRHALVALA